MRRTLLAAACILAMEAARAQQAAPPTGAAETLEEVVVTAEKRTTDLQKTPASIVVISGETITREAKTSLGDLLRDVPGVTVTGDSNNPDEIFIRGIGSSDPNNSSQVSIIIDGISNATGISGASALAGTGISGTGAASTANYDVGQVEVLSGPQGTLYGGSTAAGAILINTSDPGFKDEVQGSVTVGNYSALQTTGVVNVPVSDKLAFRAAVFSASHDGYLSNGVDDEDTQSARLKVKYKWGEGSGLVLTGEFTKTGGKGGDNEGSLPGQAAYPGGHLSSPDPWYTFEDPDQSASSKTLQLYGRLDLNLGWAQLTALPNYVHSVSSTFAQEYVLPTSAHTVADTQSMEARLSSPMGSRWFWQVGGYASQATVPSSYNASTNNLFASPPGTLPYQKLVSLKSDTDSYAVFANTSYPIVGSLRMTGGLRWEQDSVDAAQQNLNGTTPTALNLNWLAYPSRTWANVSWRGGLDYDLTQSNLLYASAATGFAPGTVQALQLPGSVGATVNSTHSQVLTQYALGSKNRFLDNTLQVNVEAYYTVYQTYNLPNPVREPDGALILYNYELAGGARTKGFDFFADYLVTKYDRLALSVSGNWASFGSQPTLPQFTNKPFLHAPVWTVGPSYQHTFPLAGGAAITAHADSQYQTRQYVAADYLPNEIDPAHWRSNATLSYDSVSGKWSLIAFIRNIENQADIIGGGGTALPTYTNATGLPTPQTLVTLGSPRTFGATLNVKL